MASLFLVLAGRAAATPPPAGATPAETHAAAADTTAADSLTGQKAVRKRRMGIFKRFVKSFDDYDTTYITPNYYDYTAMLQSTNFFQTYHLTGREEDGRSQSISTKPAPNVKIGPYFGWRWIFLGYTFDVSHPQALGSASELSLSLYSSMLGLDAIYLRNDGDYRLRRVKGFDGVNEKALRGTPFKGIDSHLFSVDVYYVANHRHFSYPAAYNQSTVQRKSCGSALLGAGFSRQRVKFDYTLLPEGLRGTDGGKIVGELKFNKVSYKYFYLSGGYGYNLVPARNLLVGVSVMPSVGIRKADGVKLKGNEFFTDLANLSFDCTSRLGVVWNNTRFFAGASFINHLYVYRRQQLSLTNSVSYFNLYAGFFFHRKKCFR